MIIRSAPSPSPLPPSLDADDTLPSIEYFFDSGNSCVITPCMRRDRNEPKKCYIVVTYAWVDDPSDSDRAEMEKHINEKLRRKPNAMDDTKDIGHAARLRDEFLNRRKR